MDIDEDIDRAETAARTIRTFAELEDESGEDFIGYTAVDDSESESDGGAEDALTLKETNKALQKQIKALKAQVDGGKKKGKGGKKASQKVTFASGLLPDWTAEADLTVKKRTHVQISAGGLEDSDAEGDNPFPPSSKPGPHTITEEELTKGAQQAKRDHSRRNELVSIVAAETDEEKEYAPRAAAKKAAVKIPPPVRVKTVKPKEESMPVKAQTSKKGCVARTVVPVKSKPQRLNGNKVRVSDLPEFAEAGWRASFLPTLYDKFFSSDKPFDAFCHGSDQFVALLQVVIEEVYPTVDYTITSSDPIYLLVSLFLFNRRNFDFPFCLGIQSCQRETIQYWLQCY
ncbi:hypothetical protein GALMADRAFT_232506 [Galerina marginata CBS 339.88]|uniref:Uncharacterized protein n=1 Tax=Galerina marginata (strain CBS 339.88) TaxID=685588 RepID=A0A067S6P7_GALM3|nr:hypothetical protein GALMADRAFT_232506 [Galerina marginata CBS 339.88]